jgi:hypothetical protein
MLVFFRYKVKSATFDENLPVVFQVNILDSHKYTTLCMCVFVNVFVCMAYLVTQNDKTGPVD